MDIWGTGEKIEKGEREKKETMKGIRMTLTSKRTGNIYNILIIFDFIFQLLQTDEKRKPRVCVVP